jgi:hypothetical protein
MPSNHAKQKYVLVVAMVLAILPSGVMADMVMNLSSPSYDFGASLLNTQYKARTATLRFTNTGASPLKGRVSLSTASAAIQFEKVAFNVQVNPGETLYGHIDIQFTPSSVGQFFETINIATDFGAFANQSIIAACYAGCHIEGNIFDYSTKKVIPGSECTSPSFEIANSKGYFLGRWFAGSYKFTVSADGYYTKVEHLFLPENSSVPWNPELVPIIPLRDAISTLQALGGNADPHLQFRIDLNRDGKLGLEETILYLRTLSELKRQYKSDLTSNLQMPITPQSDLQSAYD